MLDKKTEYIISLQNELMEEKDKIIDDLVTENKHLKKDRDYYKQIVDGTRDYLDKDDWGC